MTFSSTDPDPDPDADADPDSRRPRRKVASSLPVALVANALTAPSDRPAHYRLSTETWEIILEAYRQGATVPELSLLWRVSEHTLRKRITVHGATKREWGDAQALQQAETRLGEAQAYARARAEAEAAKAEAASPGARAAVLFGDFDCDPGDAPGSAELAQQALTGSGRAMRAGMWNEARALAMLAESYTRLAERKASGEMTPETAPLALLVAIAFGSESRWRGRMSMIGARDNDPDTEVKRKFWDRKEARDAMRAVEETKLTLRYSEGLIAGRRIEARLQAEAREGGGAG